MSCAVTNAEIYFQVESLSAIFDEVQLLWRAHWDETEGYRDEIGYQPDLEQFRRLDELGWFLQCTARSELNDELVGHIGYILHKSRHTSKQTAVEDYFYFKPEFRSGFNALRLLRFCIEELRERGCTEVGMSAKLTNDIGPLLRRVGFKHVADFYTMNMEQPYVLQQPITAAAA